MTNYEANEQKLLQLVLFAQDELRLRLAHPNANIDTGSYTSPTPASDRPPRQTRQH